jgi:hypothetical protein
MRCTWGPCTIERALPGCPQEHPAEAQHMAVRGGRSRTLLAVPPGCAGCSGQFVLPKGSHGQAATLIGAVGAGCGIRQGPRQLQHLEADRDLGWVVVWWRLRPCAGSIPTTTHSTQVRHIKGQHWKAGGPIGYLLTHLVGPCSSLCPRACTQSARISERADPLASSGPRGHALPIAHNKHEGSRMTPQATPCQGISSGVQIVARSTEASSQRR